MSWYRFLRAIWETGFGAVELGVEGYDRARKLLRGEGALRVQPFTHRDVERQQAQIRSSARGEKLTILPPR